MTCAAIGRWIGRSAIGAALAICILGVQSRGQDRNGSVPSRPRYVGPPASIDGPEPIPSPSDRVTSPSDRVAQPGEAVILPEGEIAEPLALPGGTIEDSLPPDWFVEEPQPQ